MPAAGVSFYVGLPGPAGRPVEDVAMAADLGVRELFTSLQIPEADVRGHLDELRRIGALARARGLRLAADFSPRTLRLLGGSLHDLTPFIDLGVTTLRIDFGLEPEAIARVARAMPVMLNASEATEQGLQACAEAGLSLPGCLACHNYYPRNESGITMGWAERTSALLHRHGLEVSAFVASQVSRRPITFEGLPTVERQRGLSPARAAMELFARGVAEQVYIGDPATDPEEVRALLAVAADPHLCLRVRAEPAAGPAESAVAFGRLHVHGAQEYELLWRARGAMEAEDLPALPPRPPLPRPRGAVCVDNAMYPRFAGSLTISKADLPPDPRVNVVGWIVPEDMVLLDLLTPRREFELIPW